MTVSSFFIQIIQVRKELTLLRIQTYQSCFSGQIAQDKFVSKELVLKSIRVLVMLISLHDLEEVKFPNEVPRPEHWGGYGIEPTRFEFWQGRPSRLHDRIEFEKNSDAWSIRRLNP